jgi:hypothetical protein
MNPDSGEREHGLDQWLDEALAQYGKSEPRSGLEIRMLARLRAEQTRVATGHRWWRSAGLVAGISAVVALVWFGQIGRKWRSIPTPMVAQHQSLGIQTESFREPPTVEPALKAAPRETTQHLALRPQTITTKLEQFPAPVPLSGQERLLARYVREFPRQAALMARVQTELQQQEEREMATPLAENAAGLKQQE